MSPLYTGKTLALSAVTQRSDRDCAAFLNAKRVVLKLDSQIQPLEGRTGDITAPDTSTTTLIHTEDTSDSEVLALEQPRAYTQGLGEEILSEDPISVSELITLSNLNTDIYKSIANWYDKDDFFRLIIKDPTAYRNFNVNSSLIFLKSNGKRTLCIPDIKINSQRVCKMIISHAHSILAYVGPSKTNTYLRDSVWWKEMGSDILAFCKSCTTCKMSKPNNQSPYRKVETLDIPSRPWEMIGIDFIGPLPESENLNGKFDMLMVIIDHLTSMVHLLPTRQSYHAKDIAEVIFDR